MHPPTDDIGVNEAAEAERALAGLAEGDAGTAAEVEEAQNILRAMASAALANPLQPGKFPLPMGEAAAESEGASPQGNGGVWRAERRYRALIEQIPVITFMAAIGESVHELYISPQIQAVLGFSQEEWLENPFLWYNQLYPEDRERWQQEFARTCTTGVQFKSEYRIIARDGRVVWIHGECQLIRDENGAPLFLQGVAYDITENKRAEEAMLQMQRNLEVMVERRTAELAAANAALREKIAEHQEARRSLAIHATELARSNAELSQFAYVASHDLQEPLRMMASFAQLLDQRYRGKMDQDADEFIHYITDGASRMQELIEDLLQYSRVGRGELVKVPVEMRRVFELACENLHAAIERSGAKVAAEDLPRVAANESQLLQVLQNLIANAIKFMPAGRAPEIDVRARREGADWIFHVRDNGIGFDPQYRDKIFLIFQRLQSRVHYPGTGIGLAICRKIVERHGGRIWAESELNRGSTFYFSLPAE